MKIEMHKFDLMMEYIDENVVLPGADVRKGLSSLIGWPYRQLNDCFCLLTGQTLTAYYQERRCYFAAMDLIHSEEKIAEIAYKYNFYDQSALNRTMTQRYGYTPASIRKEQPIITSHRYRFEDIYVENLDTKAQKSLYALENHCDPRSPEIDPDWIMELEECCREHHMDMELGYEIADLAERMDVPTPWLMSVISLACEEYALDLGTERLSMEEERAVSLGISSYNEKEAICQYYGCDVFGLTPNHVWKYKKIKKKSKE